jgi:hypothetical protein
MVMKLNSEGDPIGEEVKKFDKVEHAQKWSVEDRGQPLEWGEEGRFFSLEGMTTEELDAMGEAGDYPPVRYWIYDTPRELEDEDFEDIEINLSRN